MTLLEAEEKSSLSLAAAAAGQRDGRNDDGGGATQAASLRHLVGSLRALAGHGDQGPVEGGQLG